MVFRHSLCPGIYQALGVFPDAISIHFKGIHWAFLKCRISNAAKLYFFAGKQSCHVFFLSANNRFLCAMQGKIRSLWRFLYFAFSTIFGIIGFFWALLWGKSKKEAGLNFRRNWLTHVPRRLGLRMQLEGEPNQGPCLYVANHISYIDPISILMYIDANIVAKAEISNWPMLGYSAEITGTIWVERDKKESRSMAAAAIRKALFDRISILVFPEGTTSAGPQTLPFRPRTFQAAMDAKIPVQPIALFYDEPDVAYIGDDTFLPHFLKLSQMKEVTGRISFGPLLQGEDTCQRAQDWINQEQASYTQNIPQHEPA